MRSLAQLGSRADFRPFVFGDPDFLQSLSRTLSLSVDFRRLEIIQTGRFTFPPRWGEVDAEAGAFAVDCLRHATATCRDEGWPLLVTAPIHKLAARLGGFQSPGQTEFVASFFPGARPAMAFFSDPLRVVLISVHVPLSEVSRMLTAELVVEKSALFYDALGRLGLQSPGVAVCGLNPHASEGGLFGDEDQKIVSPAVSILKDRFGPASFSGPYPADSLFWRAARGEFQGVVALYHDQGLIPVKLLAFESAANVTLGLPIWRTSPDHGTAFELAGRGVASERSFTAAIEWGLKLNRPLLSRE